MRTKKTATTPTNTMIVGIMGLILLACLALPGAARAQEGLVSTMELLEGVASIDGIRLVKTADMSGTVYTEDYGTSQVLEIIRPNMGPISIGRLSTSCTCISASVAKKSFAQGERAFIEVRNVKASKPGGATYAVWAQLTSPYRAALQCEIFVLSDRQPGDPVPVPATPAAAAPAAPAKSEPAPAEVKAAESSPAKIVPATPDTPEIIIPTADGAVTVTSSATVSGTATASVIVEPSSSGAPFRYEDIAPYKPKPSEERAAAEAAIAAEREKARRAAEGEVQ